MAPNFKAHLVLLRLWTFSRLELVGTLASQLLVG